MHLFDVFSYLTQLPKCTPFCCSFYPFPSKHGTGGDLPIFIAHSHNLSSSTLLLIVRRLSDLPLSYALQTFTTALIMHSTAFIYLQHSFHRFTYSNYSVAVLPGEQL